MEEQLPKQEPGELGKDGETLGEPEKHLHHLWTRLAVLVVLLLVAGGLVYYHWRPQDARAKLATTTQTASSPAVTAPSLTANVPGTKVVYSRQTRLSPSSITGTIWTMNTDGSDQTEINVGSAAAYPIEAVTRTNWIFYKMYDTSDGDSATVLYVYNMSTHKSTGITPGDQPGAAIDIQPESVSPDGGRVVYNVTYNQIENGSVVCGQQPCASVDLYPNHKSGSYAYNAATGQTTYLGSIGSPTSWLSDNVNFYASGGYTYHSYQFGNNLYRVNADTGTATTISALPSSLLSSPNSTYLTYPVNSNTSIIDEGNTLQVVLAGKSRTVDQGNLCDNSSCVQLAPDLAHACYTKSDVNNSVDAVLSLNLSTYVPTTMLKAATGETFNGDCVWLDSSRFIVEDQIGTYPNDKHYVMLVNVATGKSTDLTNTGDTHLISF